MKEGEVQCLIEMRKREVAGEVRKVGIFHLLVVWQACWSIIHSQYCLSFAHYHKPEGWNTDTWRKDWYITRSVWFQSPCFPLQHVSTKGALAFSVLTPKAGKLTLPEVGVHFAFRACPRDPWCFLSDHLALVVVDGGQEAGRWS